MLKFYRKTNEVYGLRVCTLKVMQLLIMHNKGYRKFMGPFRV